MIPTPPKPTYTPGTRLRVIQRVRAHLDAVALCRVGAFASAVVTALRTEDQTIVDAELLPNDIDPELVERCRKLGIALPQRYQAHPEDETDTPSGEGTSEVGTRQPDTNSTLEET